MLLLRSVLSIVKKAQRERKTSGEIVAPTGKEKKKKKTKTDDPSFSFRVYLSLTFVPLNPRERKPKKARRIKCLFSIKKRNAEWK